MNRILVVLVVASILSIVASGQDRDQRIADLERQLAEAKGSVATLQKTIESLSTEVQALRQPDPRSAVVAATAAPGAVPPVPAPSKEAGGEKTGAAPDFTARIIDPDIGSNEHDHALEAKPEIFIQTRYSVAPLDGSGMAFDPNLRLSRIETRWAGKINDRLGAGMEIQFQESVEGSPEKLVNDAFLEYYVNDHTTVRAGQFIKPFGFDVQQSSWLRESPERPIFSGYFFPGDPRDGSPTNEVMSGRRDPLHVLSGRAGRLRLYRYAVPAALQMRCRCRNSTHRQGTCGRAAYSYRDPPAQRAGQSCHNHAA
jgi:hypothetical protein